MKIYSNAKAVELFVNGISQGSQDAGTDDIFIWKNVTLSPGDNKISAQATANGKVLTDECVWNLSPAGSTK